MPAGNRFHLINFCKHKQLTKVDKTIELPSPFNTATASVVAGASLGCNIPLSYRHGEGTVVSRAKNDTGADTKDLLSSFNPDYKGSPSASAWIAALKTRVLSGSDTLTDPASRISRHYDVSVEDTNWMEDHGGIQAASTIPSVPRTGFGSELGIKRTTIVASGQEFLVQNKLKAGHRTKHYAQVATVPSLNHPLALTYNVGLGTYDWPTIPGGPGIQRLVRNAGNSIVDGYAWAVELRMWCTYPAVIGHSGMTYIPSNTNGPGQDRRYSLYEIDDIIAPDYGGSVTGNMNITPLRAGAVLYGHIEEVGAHLTQILVNGTDVLPSFNAAVLPTPQRLPFTSGVTVIPELTDFTTVHTYPEQNIGSFLIQVASPYNTVIGELPVATIGTIQFAVVPTPGLLYEAVFYISIFKS